MRLLILLTITFLAEVNSQFSAAGQKKIVDIHNNLRSRIAKGTFVANGTKKSPGTNILKMKWNSALAARAQKYVANCPICPSKALDIGENFFMKYDNKTLRDVNQYGVEAVTLWENQFQKSGWKSNFRDMDMFYKGGINYATQMAWARNGLVGCGVKTCQFGKLHRIVVDCMYTPGAFVGANIYESGPTCSKCPKGTKCEKATGLCV